MLFRRCCPCSRWLHEWCLLSRCLRNRLPSSRFLHRSCRPRSVQMMALWSGRVSVSLLASALLEAGLQLPPVLETELLVALALVLDLALEFGLGLVLVLVSV